MALAPPLIPPRLSSLDLSDIGFARVYLSISNTDPNQQRQNIAEGCGTKENSKGNILCKSPCEGLLAADFLRPDKTIDRDGNGPVNVLRGAVLGETHLAKGFADSHDGFEVADLPLAVSVFGGSKRTRRVMFRGEGGKKGEGLQ